MSSFCSPFPFPPQNPERSGSPKYNSDLYYGNHLPARLGTDLSIPYLTAHCKTETTEGFPRPDYLEEQGNLITATGAMPYAQWYQTNYANDDGSSDLAGVGRQFDYFDNPSSTTFCHHDFGLSRDDAYNVTSNTPVVTDLEQSEWLPTNRVHAVEPPPLSRLSSEFTPVTLAEVTVPSNYMGSEIFTGDGNTSVASRHASAAYPTPGSSSFEKHARHDQPSYMVKLSLPRPPPDTQHQHPTPELSNSYMSQDYYQSAGAAQMCNNAPFSGSLPTFPVGLSSSQVPNPGFAMSQTAAVRPKSVKGVELGSGKTDFLHERNILDTKLTLNFRHAGVSVDTDTIFGSWQEAYEWRHNQQMSEDNDDNTIPTTDEQKCAIVKNLVKAFKSVAFAQDKIGICRHFNEERHDNHRVEVMCWNLLEACIQRSQAGPLLRGYVDPKQIKTSRDGCDTFERRMDEMLNSMKTHKTICKHLYDSPYFFKFVDHPKTSAERIISNRALNERKGEQIKAGKKADPSLAGPRNGGKKKRSRTAKTEGEEEEDEEEELAIEDFSDEDYDTPQYDSPTVTPQRRVRSTRGRLRSNSSNLTNISSPFNGFVPDQSYMSPSAGSFITSASFHHRSNSSPSGLPAFPALPPIDSSGSVASNPLLGSPSQYHALPRSGFPQQAAGRDQARPQSIRRRTTAGRTLLSMEQSAHSTLDSSREHGLPFNKARGTNFDDGEEAYEDNEADNSDDPDYTESPSKKVKN